MYALRISSQEFWNISIVASCGKSKIQTMSLKKINNSSER